MNQKTIIEKIISDFLSAAKTILTDDTKLYDKLEGELCQPTSDADSPLIIKEAFGGGKVNINYLYNKINRIFQTTTKIIDEKNSAEINNLNEQIDQITSEELNALKYFSDLAELKAIVPALVEFIRVDKNKSERIQRLEEENQRMAENSQASNEKKDKNDKKIASQKRVIANNLTEIQENDLIERLRKEDTDLQSKTEKMTTTKLGDLHVDNIVSLSGHVNLLIDNIRNVIGTFKGKPEILAEDGRPGKPAEPNTQLQIYESNELEYNQKLKEVLNKYGLPHSLILTVEGKIKNRVLLKDICFRLLLDKLLEPEICSFLPKEAEEIPEDHPLTELTKLSSHTYQQLADQLPAAGSSNSNNNIPLIKFRQLTDSLIGNEIFSSSASEADQQKIRDYFAEFGIELAGSQSELAEVMAQTWGIFHYRLRTQEPVLKYEFFGKDAEINPSIMKVQGDDYNEEMSDDELAKLKIFNYFPLIFDEKEKFKQALVWSWNPTAEQSAEQTNETSVPVETPASKFQPHIINVEENNSGSGSSSSSHPATSSTAETNPEPEVWDREQQTQMFIQTVDDISQRFSQESWLLAERGSYEDKITELTINFTKASISLEKHQKNWAETTKPSRLKEVEAELAAMNNLEECDRDIVKSTRLESEKNSLNNERSELERYIQSCCDRDHFLGKGITNDSFKEWKELKDRIDHLFDFKPRKDKERRRLVIKDYGVFLEKFKEFLLKYQLPTYLATRSEDENERAKEFLEGIHLFYNDFIHEKVWEFLLADFTELTSRFSAIKEFIVAQTQGISNVTWQARVGKTETELNKLVSKGLERILYLQALESDIFLTTGLADKVKDINTLFKSLGVNELVEEEHLVALLEEIIIRARKIKLLYLSDVGCDNIIITLDSCQSILNGEQRKRLSAAKAYKKEPKLVFQSLSASESDVFFPLEDKEDEEEMHNWLKEWTDKFTKLQILESDCINKALKELGCFCHINEEGKLEFGTRFLANFVSQTQRGSRALNTIDTSDWIKSDLAQAIQRVLEEKLAKVKDDNPALTQSLENEIKNISAINKGKEKENDNKVASGSKQPAPPANQTSVPITTPASVIQPYITNFGSNSGSASGSKSTATVIVITNDNKTENNNQPKNSEPAKENNQNQSSNSNQQPPSEKSIEIPLDAITDSLGNGIVINNAQEGSIFVTGQMANPITVTISGIEQIWPRALRHFAKYIIEPVTIPLTDGKKITINKLLFNYRCDNFEPSYIRKEEDRKFVIKTEIPGFVDENTPDNTRMIGESKIIRIGDTITIQLATDNKKTSKNGFQKWKSWSLLGSDNYSLEIYDDYTLTAANGEQFSFSENNLSALLSEARAIALANCNSRTTPEIFQEIINDIKKHPEFGELTAEEKETTNQELDTLLLAIIAKKHKKDLLDYFPDKKERNKWQEYLTKLQETEETEWLRCDEKTVFYLNNFAKMGYHPDHDISNITFFQHVELEGPTELIIKVYYRADNGEIFSAFDWPKTIVNHYAPLRKKIDEEITENPRWNEKIAAVIGNREAADTQTTSERIDEFIKGSNEEEIESNVEKISNLFQRELAVQKTAANQEWTKITELERKNIFYSNRLFPAEIEIAQQILTDIEKIITINKDNISELTAEKLQELSNSLARSSDKLKETINYATELLFRQAELAIKYLTYYDIEQLTSANLKDVFILYKKIIDFYEFSPSLDDAREQLYDNFLQGIYGAEWREAFFANQRRVCAWHTLVNWKDKDFLTNPSFLNSPENGPEQAINKENIVSALKYCEKEWQWACEKSGVEFGKINALRKELNLRRDEKEITDEIAKNENNYLALKPLIAELTTDYPEVAQADGMKVVITNFFELELNWLFQQAKLENATLAELKKYQKEIDDYQTVKQDKKEVWQKLNTGASLEVNGELDNEYEEITKKIANLEAWEKSAATGLKELATEVKSVWTTEELTVFQAKIADFPPYLDQEEAPSYYRIFQVAYKQPATIKEQINKIEAEAIANEKIYKGLAEKLAAILEKTEYQEETVLRGDALPKSLFEQITSDINFLDKFINSPENPSPSAEDNVSPPYQKLYQKYPDEITQQKVFLLRKAFLSAELVEGEWKKWELNDYEKAFFNNVENEPLFIAKLVRGWINIFPDPNQREEWQKLCYDKEKKFLSFEAMKALNGAGWTPQALAELNDEYVLPSYENNGKTLTNLPALTFDSAKKIVSVVDFSQLNDFCKLFSSIATEENPKKEVEAEIATFTTLNAQFRKDITDEWTTRKNELVKVAGEAQATKKINDKITEANQADLQPARYEGLLQELTVFQTWQNETHENPFEKTVAIAKKNELSQVITDLDDKLAPWNDFFSEHSNITDKKVWYDSAKTAAEAAKYYQDAEQFDSGNKPWNLTDGEKAFIQAATTPTEITKVIKSIENARRATYEKFLSQDASGKIWESNLTDEQIKRIKEASPDEIETVNLAITWEIFFAKRGIIANDEKEIWKNESGLTISEVKETYDKRGWTKLTAPTFTELNKDTKKGKYNAEKYNVGVNLLTDYRSEVDKSFQLSAKIADETDIKKLPTDEFIKNAFNKNKVPNSCKWDVIISERNEAKLCLFQQNFCDLDTKPKFEDITEDEKTEYTAWLDNKTGLSQDGNDEKTAKKNGWTDPTKIKNGLINYEETITWPDGSVKKLARKKVAVLKIDRTELAMALDLMADIKRQTDINTLKTLFTTRQTDWHNLMNAKLPDDLHKDNIKGFYETKLWKLVGDKFIADFGSAGGEAKKLADKPANRNQVLAFSSIKNKDRTQNNVILLEKGKTLGQIFNWEWTNKEELFFVPISDNKGNIITILNGEEFKPSAITRSEAVKKQWIVAFWGGDAPSLADNETIKYRKGGIPADKARQVYKNGWGTTEFSWSGTRAIIANYGTNKNFNALIVDKKELNKVNDILTKISQATKTSDLLPIDIKKYIESKVPTTKNYDKVKTIYNNKKAQLEQDAADKKARIKAIQAVNDYWTSLNLTDQIENICGNNWKSNFANLKGTAIVGEENRLENLISRAKVQPDITAIEAELNQKTVISASELKNSNYQTEMLNLANNDTKRASRKAEILAEITQIREDKLAKVRTIITQAQSILDKDGATKEELKQAINNLKALANAATDSAEKVIWEASKDTNQKLLTDLEEKLSKIVPSKPNKEKPDAPSQIPIPENKPQTLAEQITLTTQKNTQNQDWSPKMKVIVKEIVNDPQLTASATTETEKITNVEQAREILTILEEVKSFQAADKENQHPDQQKKIIKLIEKLQTHKNNNSLVYQVVNSHGREVDKALQRLLSLQATQQTNPQQTSWWQQQTIPLKLLIIGGIILVIITMGVIVSKFLRGERKAKAK